jgi:branched-chain amino acid transport system substrate-binding protein
MNMRKKGFLIMCIIFVLTVLSACGNSAIQSSSSSSDSKSQTDKQTESSKSIKIGNILPFSGVYASLGKAVF